MPTMASVDFPYAAPTDRDAPTAQAALPAPKEAVRFTTRVTVTHEVTT
ncbi:hypothetical protein ABZ840_08420 [Streptomyces sp. NPDC047117]